MLRRRVRMSFLFLVVVVVTTSSVVTGVIFRINDNISVVTLISEELCQKKLNVVEGFLLRFSSLLLGFQAMT